MERSFWWADSSFSSVVRWSPTPLWSWRAICPFHIPWITHIRKAFIWISHWSRTVPYLILAAVVPFVLVTAVYGFTEKESQWNVVLHCISHFLDGQSRLRLRSCLFLQRGNHQHHEECDWSTSSLLFPGVWLSCHLSEWFCDLWTVWSGCRSQQVHKLGRISIPIFIALEGSCLWGYAKLSFRSFLSYHGGWTLCLCSSGWIDPPSEMAEQDSPEDCHCSSLLCLHESSCLYW